VSHPIRVKVERGKKKRVVASAFDSPGWDRSAKTEDDALAVLAAHRPRYAPIANSAGHGDEYRRLAAADDKANQWDGRLGKQTLCQLSYSRSGGPDSSARLRSKPPRSPRWR
jgi:hypothetical protein